MEIRPMGLSEGWYPQNTTEMQQYLSLWDNMEPLEPMDFSGALLPHAGWYYSGHFSYKLLLSLKRNPDIVLILGGHLRRNDPFLIWDFLACETPFGNININQAMTEDFKKRISPITDNYKDNSIEVFLPLIKWLWPESFICALRIPPDLSIFNHVNSFRDIILKHAKNPLIIASSDLTHYGTNYDFKPDLKGLKASQWVKQNDHKLLDALVSQRSEEILSITNLNNNACSSGAITMLSKLSSLENGSVELMEYGTSLERGASESFVGYASVSFA